MGFPPLNAFQNIKLLAWPIAATFYGADDGDDGFNANADADDDGCGW